MRLTIEQWNIQGKTIKNFIQSTAPIQFGLTNMFNPFNTIVKDDKLALIQKR